MNSCSRKKEGMVAPWGVSPTGKLGSKSQSQQAVVISQLMTSNTTLLGESLSTWTSPPSFPTPYEITETSSLFYPSPKATECHYGLHCVFPLNHAYAKVLTPSASDFSTSVTIFETRSLQRSLNLNEVIRVGSK
jgi:hypothetical protein